MIAWSWKMFAVGRGRRGDGRIVRYGGRKLRAACEQLDGRQLLSTGATAATIAVLAPPPTAAANAAAILKNDSPRAFAQFAKTLAREASLSHVTSAEASMLAEDLQVINQDIASAGLTADQAASATHVSQDWVDNTFTYGINHLSTVDYNLQQTLKDVPSAFTPSASGAASPIDQLMGQLEVIAKEARSTTALRSAQHHADRILTNALGPKPDTDLGAGAMDRDPLPVYYDAEVVNFIK
jgi:hypothetical protein